MRMKAQRGVPLNGRWHVILLLCILLVSSCREVTSESQPLRLRLATTTSTENTGLLYEILPPFERMFNVKVDVIAVGTGKALKLAENGDVDAVLVHAREAEDAFVASGFGVNRRDLMYNDFIIAGPEEDPANVRGLKDAARAFVMIAKNRASFVSRGDDSGTHKKELAIWRESGLTPSRAWYIESGQGMGPTLQIADEKRAYCLTDRGTYLAFKEKLDLAIVCQGDRRLFNPYGIIAVSPALHPDARYVHAMALIGWLTSPRCQRMIGEFKRSGQPLFHPGAWQTGGS
ncbi:MAG: substrate-binding domain-containing protein [bacterium]